MCNCEPCLAKAREQAEEAALCTCPPKGWTDTCKAHGTLEYHGPTPDYTEFDIEGQVG